MRRLSKKCPHCGADIPEEASFCLNCFCLTNENSENELPPETTVKLPPYLKIKQVFSDIAKKISSDKKALALSIAALIILAVFLVFLILALIPANAVSSESSTVTTLVAVTDAKGEPVTNSKGEQVYEVKEVTTKKQSLLGKIKDKITGEDEKKASGTDSKSSAEKQSADGTTIISSSSKVQSQSQTNSTGKPTEGGQSNNSVVFEEPQKAPAVETTEKEYDSFETAPYGSSGTKVCITKYTGNSSSVVIPAVIDGKPVGSIERDAFKDNGKIKTITFESSSEQKSLYVESGCFNNLSSLTTINMPDTDLGIVGNFSENCPKLKTINIDNPQYRFIDGALYYWTSQYWILRFICPASELSDLTVPSWCRGIENCCNLSECYNLKIIRLHKNVHSFPSIFEINEALEAVYVEDGNSSAFDKDGVLFVGTTTTLYPSSKKDKSFTIPENVSFRPPLKPNKYLETLKIPKSSSLQSSDSVYFQKAFPNLKTIYIEEGSSCLDEAQNKFTGKVIVY